MRLSKDELDKLKAMIEKSSKKKLELYKRLNPTTPKGLIVFAGDSMIDYMDLDAYLPELKAINRGVAGATTKFIKDHFDEIFGEIDPTELWISIGSNDLVLLECNSEEVVQNISELFSLIKSKFPNIKIYYLSTTPVIKEGHQLYKRIYIGGRTKEDNNQINEGVKRISGKKSINYVDVYTNLVDDKGYLNEYLTADGIHLNSRGYQIYTELIRKVIQTNDLNRS